MLPGSKIFEIMFSGTRFDDTDKEGSPKEFAIDSNFEEIRTKFENVMSDIAMLKNEIGSKSQIEQWFDVLKKVMRLHGHGIEEAAVNDFYIYLIEEDEKENQMKLNFKNKYRAIEGTKLNRKIGFWCFNSALGMRSIQ